MFDGLDSINDWLIESDLLLLLIIDLLLLLGSHFSLSFEELVLSGLWLSCLRFSKISIFNVLEAVDVNFDDGAGSNDVGLVDSLQRNTVDLVRAGDEEESALQLLEENDSSALKSTGEKNEDTSGDYLLAKFGWLGNLRGTLEVSLDVIRVVIGSFGHSYDL